MTALPPPQLPDEPQRDRLERVGDQLRRLPTWGWVVLGVVALVIAGAVTRDKGDDQPTASDREYSAFVVCKDFVKDRLKSPGSAVFRNYFEDDGEVQISGPERIPTGGTPRTRKKAAPTPPRRDERLSTDGWLWVCWCSVSGRQRFSEKVHSWGLTPRTDGV